MGERISGARAAKVMSPSSFSVPYPFIREMLSLSGTAEIETWRPGVRMEPATPDDCEAVADGMGWQHLFVVSEHTPGRFPTRVFYTMFWQDPDGKVLGKPRLHIATKDKFRRITNGYRRVFRLLPCRAAPVGGVARG
jgi:hypothetical protein